MSWTAEEAEGRALSRSVPTFFRRLLQKVAISSAEEVPATVLLQKLSKASLRALWNRELLLKQPSTYFRYLSWSSITELTYCCSWAPDSFEPFAAMQAQDFTKVRKRFSQLYRPNALTDPAIVGFEPCVKQTLHLRTDTKPQESGWCLLQGQMHLVTQESNGTEVKHRIKAPASFFWLAASVTSLTSLDPSLSTCFLKASATGSSPLGMRENRRNILARSSFCTALPAYSASRQNV